MVKKLRLAESDMGYKTDLFELYPVSGVNVDDVPFEEWRIKSKGLAEKCVVEVRLVSNYFRDIKNYDGVNPVKITYHDATVNWGMSTKPIDVDDMIYCLEEAKKFAERVRIYLTKKGIMV